MIFSNINIRLRLKHKLILLFSAIVIFSIFLTSYLTFHETSNILQNEIKVLSSKILKEVNLNLDRYFNQYEQLFFNIASSIDFERWLLSEKGEKLYSSLNYRNIYDRYINPITSIYPEIISITLLNENGNENTYYLNMNITYKERYSLRNEPWFKEVGKNSKTYIVSDENTNYRNSNGAIEKFYSLRLVRKFSFSNKSIGYIQIDCSLDSVNKILQEMKYSDNGECLILNESGLIMAHTDINKISDFYNKKIFLSKIKEQDNGFFINKEEKTVIIFDTIEDIGWKTVAVIPIKSFSEGINRIWSITFIVSCLSIIFSVLLVFLTSSTLTKNVRSMMNVIKQTRSGNMDLRVSIKGNDEISELAAAYNSMLDHLDQYIAELAEAKMLQQEAVLSALQSQINSHFLYNTLEIINSMAFISGQDDISNAVICLSQMLRYTSSYTNIVVTINEEVNHLKDYLQIMKLQIGDKLNYSFELENGVENASCLKAIIQPIVENSLRHGFESTGKSMHIKIKVGYSGSNHIFVLIEDNGNGFLDSKLEEIRKQLANTANKEDLKAISKVGLINVHYRLKVFYNNDPETGLTIENIGKRQGARVKITFPLRRKDEN